MDHSSAPNLIQLRAAPVTVKTRCAACGVVHSVVETFFSTCVEMSCPRFAATQSTRQRLRKTEPGVTVPLATRHGVSALPTRKRSRPSRSLTNAAFAAIGCRWIHARSDLAATNSRRPTTVAASSWLARFDSGQVAPGLYFSVRCWRETPFSIPRVQTDRGAEFFGGEVQRRMMGEAIRFRRSPHLNRKVERVQRTILEEFWAMADPRAAYVGEQLALWVHTTTGTAHTSHCTGIHLLIGCARKQTRRHVRPQSGKERIQVRHRAVDMPLRVLK